MNRMLLHLLVGLVVTSHLVASQEPVANAQPRVVIRHFPQSIDRGVLKWDCPVFAAYTDGVVIWRKGWAASVGAFSETQSQMAEETVRKLEAMAAHYGEKTFVLTASSDPEVTTVWSSGKTLTILGDWRKPSLLEAVDPKDAENHNWTNENEQKLWSTLPAEIRDALATAAIFDDKDGKAWRPEKISLLLQPPNRTRVEPAAWPAQWPQSFTGVPGSQAMKWIELPGSMLDELLELLPPDGQPKAVLLGNEARYAEIRFVFPRQDVWGQPKRSGQDSKQNPSSARPGVTK